MLRLLELKPKLKLGD